MDIKGPERLERVLRQYRPSSISVEFPRDIALEVAREKYVELREQRLAELEEARIDERLKLIPRKAIRAIGYEVLVPYEYCRCEDAELYFVDVGGWEIPREDTFVANMLAGVMQNEKRILQMDEEELLREYVRVIDAVYEDIEAYREIHQNIPNEQVSVEPIDKLFFEEKQEEREKAIADELVRVRPEMHVGGIAHMYPEYGMFEIKTLYDRVKDLVEERKKLCDF